MRAGSWTDITVRGLPLLDVSVALLLSVAAVVTVTGTPGADEAHRVAGAVCVLAMTLPVAWSRRAPVAAAAVLAAGSLLNMAAIGPMVRCGAALPAVFIVGFAVAWRCDRRQAGVGLALCAVNVLFQTISDPRLGVGQFPLMFTLLCVFFALGRVTRARAAAVEALRQRTAELRRQRDRTARLAALTDRARVSADVEEILRQRLGRITDAARAGRMAVGDDPDAAVSRLVVIEREARDGLQRLRAILGVLDADAPPSRPPPTLADLPALIARATSAAVRLSVEGDPRQLPVGFELTACRVVEHFVTAVVDRPDARVDVRLRFTPEAFELRLSGPAAADVEFAAVLAAARLRAALHAGKVDGRCEAGRCVATAEIPLVSAYA